MLLSGSMSSISACNEKHRLLENLRISVSIILLGILFACSDATIDTGRDFRMAVRAEPPTLDWTLATDSISVNLLTNLMEGLPQYDADLKPIPAVAERWEFSEDGHVVTFCLRDDVFWSDGRPVTAGDFEYSWKRLLDPKTAAQYAYFLFDVETPPSSTRAKSPINRK